MNGTDGPIIIGITGGSSSGKSAIAESVKERLLLEDKTFILPMKSFYKDATELPKVNHPEYNFDHPDAFEFDLMLATLKKVRRGESCYIPQYNMMTRSRNNKAGKIRKVHVVIFEGILSLYWPEVRDMLDIRIFVHEDDDTRLCNRLMREKAKGREINEVLEKYVSIVKPSFMRYIEPTMKHADLILPNGLRNQIGISAVVQLVRMQLMAKGVVALHKSYAMGDNEAKLVHNLEHLPELQSLVDLLAAEQSVAREMQILYCDRAAYLVLDYCASLFSTNSQVIHIAITGTSDIMENGLHTFHRLARIGKLHVEDRRTADRRTLFTDWTPSVAKESNSNESETSPRHRSPITGERTPLARTPGLPGLSSPKKSPGLSPKVLEFEPQERLPPPQLTDEHKLPFSVLEDSVTSPRSPPGEYRAGGAATPARRTSTSARAESESADGGVLHVSVTYMPKAYEDSFCVVLFPVLVDTDFVTSVLACLTLRFPPHRIILTGFFADPALTTRLSADYVGLQLVFAKLRPDGLRPLDHFLRVNYLGL
jgi:uridine kinase